jgi:nucleoside phosphorylase/5'-deoxynucleotidase YfbR-like HD superfamily hydrolase
MKKRVDIVVITALQEEFDVIRGELGLSKCQDIDKDFGEWYEWHFTTSRGKDRKALFTFIGEMGPANAVKFTTGFLEHYTPNILVNLGISGTLSNDVGLADVVIATLADLYEEGGAIIDINGGPHLLPSGIPIPTGYFKENVEHFPYQFRANYRRWQAACNSACQRVIGSLITAIPRSLLNSPNKLHTGHVACGSIVVKGEAWKNSLLSKDRRYLAVDMESAAIAFAQASRDFQNRTRILVIRGISDPADNRKKELDDVGQNGRGAIRKWAVLNGVAFLREFLPTLEEELMTDLADEAHNGGAVSLEVRQLNYLVPEVVASYKQYGAGALRAYDTFFTCVQRIESSAGLIDDIILKLESHPGGPSSIASVTGFAGTGKSALLSCIYLRQMERFKSKETVIFPVYLNLRYYILEVAQNIVSADEVGRLFSQDVQRLLNEEQVIKNKALMFIVDGCDEYYRHPAQSFLDRELTIAIERLSKSDKLITIVGIGQAEQSFAGEWKSQTLAGASKEVLIELQRFPTDHPDLPKVLQAYTNLSPKRSSIDLARRIRVLIGLFRIDQIDLFILSLLEMAIRNDWRTEPHGLGALYYEYCKEKIRLKKQDATLTNKECQFQLRSLAKKVFDVYVKREPQLDERHDDLDLTSLFSYIPHLHPSVKEFLIAEHVVERITLGDIAEDNLLEYIYPYGINRFVKSIINRNPDTQWESFRTIERIYPNVGMKQKSQLGYIIGRFQDRDVSLMAVEFLKKVLRDESQDINELGDPRDSSYRQWLLMKRTIYISLIYYGSNGIASEYLKKLLTQPIWDDLNRGFHLEYYEDFEHVPAPDKMIAFDDLSIKPDKTFQILFDKIASDSEHNKTRPESIIELHTLCSLCVNRHLVGKLVEDKRWKLHNLLVKLLQRKSIRIPQFYVGYLEMARDLLGRPRTSVGEVFGNLLALKRVNRAGWNSKRVLDGREIVRKCPNPETVAAHTFGCMLIADAFLPERSNNKDYSKAEVLRILLIHDLAEAFEGDKAAFDKTEDDIRKEDERMHRIAALGAIEVFAGIRRWYETWETFTHSSSINAQIAADIDDIECYFELAYCAGREGYQIPDAEDWAKEIIVRTDEGKRILDCLSHEGAPMLKWYA